MYKFVSLAAIYFIISVGFVSAEKKADATGPQATEWKAGVAKINITPTRPLWMNGYGFRDHPSEGSLQPLWVKALALEDAEGQQSVLVTADLLGMPQGMSNEIRDRVQTRFGLSRAQILLNSSHTHSGPALDDALLDIFTANDRQREQVKAYSQNLVGRIVNLVGTALRNLEPAALYSGHGVARFAVNRRNNEEGELESLTELAGPSDHAVPVIKVVDSSGELKTVVFGYACHATVLRLYRFSGDYPGYAQQELERNHPGATAMFFQGTGGDQNPLPRRTVPLAEQYGRELAAAVERVLAEDGLLRPLPARLRTGYSEVEIELSTPPTRSQLEELAGEGSGSRSRWAGKRLEQFEREGSLPRTYPYPVQVWRLGEQTLIGMGGEVVVDYAIELKRIFGQQIFVLGYSNDVMSYIPSARIVREGGYEGAHSQIPYGQPSPWKANIETIILNEVVKVADQVGVPVPETTLMRN